MVKLMTEYTLTDIEAMLPHILKRENIARYESGKVLIGNRAAYPFEKKFRHLRKR